jgi:hypothetical protein
MDLKVYRNLQASIWIFISISGISLLKKNYTTIPTLGKYITKKSRKAIQIFWGESVYMGTDLVVRDRYKGKTQLKIMMKNPLRVAFNEFYCLLHFFLLHCVYQHISIQLQK